MLSRDLIATLIKTFHEELEEVRDGGRKYENISPYNSFYESYFKCGREWFLTADSVEITAFFADDPIYKLEMLTELLYRDARELTDRELQTVLYHKVLELYEVIDQKSMVFSIERMTRVEEIKKSLRLSAGAENTRSF